MANIPYLRALAILGIWTAATVSTRGQSDLAGSRIEKRVDYPNATEISFAFADGAQRQLYVPRGNEILILDLDTLGMSGSMSGLRARDAATDPRSLRGFSCSKPVGMWDTKSLELLSTIEVKGRPVSLFFEPELERMYLVSQTVPSLTILDAKAGGVIGTVNLTGAAAHGVGDGHGRLFVDFSDRNVLAVVDARSLRVGSYLNLGQSQGALGLSIDLKNNILYAFRQKPSACIIVRTTDGRTLGSVPLGPGLLGGGFNPGSSEAYSYHEDGTLKFIRATDPDHYAVAQTISTGFSPKVCAVDEVKNRYILAGYGPGQAPSSSGSAAGKNPGGGAEKPAALALIAIAR